MANWITEPAEYDHTKTLYENKQRDRGTIRCTCGAAVPLDGALYAPSYAADCDQCGALYNLSGQALRAQSEWEDAYDD